MPERLKEERVMRYGVATLLCCAAVAAVLAARPAAAVKPFFEQFKALYVKSDTTDHTMRIFNAAVEKKQCGVCHRGKPAQKNFNPYGAQVSQLLNAKRDAGNPKAIRAALKQVEKKKADPNDLKALSFGTRLKQGKLPVGEIHVKPKEEDSSN
jgi:hypothetical protein